MATMTKKTGLPIEVYEERGFDKDRGVPTLEINECEWLVPKRLTD